MILKINFHSQRNTLPQTHGRDRSRISAAGTFQEETQMKRIRLLGRICLPITLFLASLAIPLALCAQDLTTTASLTGTVTDSTGALVAQAAVTVSGVDNGVVRTVKTDAVGGYTVTLLPPATYNVRVGAKGFQAYEQKGITLRPGQGARQDIALAVGSEIGRA